MTATRYRQNSRYRGSPVSRYNCTIGSRTLVAAIPTCVLDAMMSRFPGSVPNVSDQQIADAA